MTEPKPSRLASRLANLRFLARAALLVESVWPALWPPLGVIGLFVCLALLDLPPRLPPLAHVALLAITTLAVLGLLFRGLRRIGLPGDRAADRRLELDSGLAHRPLSVLTDRPARIDAAGMALWQAHVARAATQLRRLRVGLPHPGLARRDKRALRGGLVVALVACLVIAGPDGPARLAASMEPAMAPSAPRPKTELRAWITPPAYTKIAPLFLRADTASISVPAGSHLTASLTGGGSSATMSLGGVAQAFRPLDEDSFQADLDLSTGGRLTVEYHGSIIGLWDLTVVADTKPVVAWAAAPGRSPVSQETRLPWKVEDDHGVVSLQAEVRLDGRTEAAPLIVPIPLPGGNAKAAHGIAQQDLTANPWAGLKVTAILVGKDYPGQTGTSEAAKFTLPERSFLNPIAKVLIEIRKGLTLHPDDRTDGLAALDALMQQPDAFGDDLGAFVNLSGIYYELVRQPSPAAIPEVQERLWLLALHMEEGQTEPTARALEEARQAAKDALDTLVQTPNQDNRDALDQRMKELEQAIERHMQALMDEARRTGEPMPAGPDRRPITEEDLKRLAERARDAIREGRTQDAQSRMAELERRLDQLRNARPGQPGQRSSQQRQRGRQQMGAVQDMVAREGGILDHAESRVDQTMRFPAGPPPAGDPNAERDADRRIQQALRRALGELMQQFGDLTGEIPPSLGEADQAMRDAGKQLGEGQDKAAGDSEQSAITALQKGAKEMGQTMARQFGPAQQGQGDEGEDGDEQGLMGMTMPDGRGNGGMDGRLPGDVGRADPRGRDPLGRRFGNGTAGADENADAMVPEERERLRTQAIQNELRRRESEKDRPQPELDYIDRLLKQF